MRWMCDGWIDGKVGLPDALIDVCIDRWMSE